MSSNYTGNPAAVQAPAPAPGPGTVPIISIPSDTVDDMSSASIAQMFKMAADYLAYLFTTIMQVFFVNKPTTASDTPQAYLKDASGNVRAVFDHNGYPSGRRSEYRENWEFNILVNTAIAGSSIFGGTGYSRWNCTTTNGTRNRIQTNPGGSGNFSSYVSAFSNAAIANDADVLYGQYPWVQITANLSLVMEFEVKITTPANATLFVGLIDQNSAGAITAPGTDARAGILKRTGDANWQTSVADGTLSTTADTTVVAATGAWTSVRIELHGANSPYSACARFFINGTLTNTVTTHTTTLATTVALTPQIAYWATGNYAGDIEVGPLFVTYNRGALSLPLV